MQKQGGHGLVGWGGVGLQEAAGGQEQWEMENGVCGLGI